MSTSQTTPTADQQGSHHWVMTLELPGYAATTRSGTWTPAPSTTRNDAFTAIRNEIAAQHPEMAKANVMFFAFEPNQL